MVHKLSLPNAKHHCISDLKLVQRDLTNLEPFSVEVIRDQVQVVREVQWSSIVAKL
jgi:hypothetical protein